MNSLLVSVIIPAYNQADYLAQAVQSVLDQTYQNFEVIVVNDASPDNTAEVMKQFSDPRVKYIVHEKNLRLSAARNTGINASRGEIIALLDGDDYFHPQKLEMHVNFLAEHPEIGVSYNARFELNHSANTIREMWRPPTKVGLIDLILGFPFSPSDTVVRRDWINIVGLFDPSMGTAEDTDFPCRLALAGCQFAGIDRALNYRRHHSGRGRKNLAGRLNDVERALEVIFADPRCPADAQALGRIAIKHHMMVLAALALIQDETALAQKYLYELMQMDPSIVEGNPGELVEFLLYESIADEGSQHELLLQKIFSQLPNEISQLSTYYDWAVARGFLWRGIRAMIWGREAAGVTHLDRAVQFKAGLDQKLIQFITHHLLGYENEFGAKAVGRVLALLKPHLNRMARHGGDKLESSYLVNRAFQNYQAGEYKNVPGKVLRAWMNDPSYLKNRGVISIFVRSMARAMR